MNTVDVINAIGGFIVAIGLIIVSLVLFIGLMSKEISAVIRAIRGEKDE